MLPEERKQEIVGYVERQEGASVAELAETLGVSESTIRRDLTDLKQDGLLRRSHGGALPAANVASEPSFAQRSVQNLDAKRAIAERAVAEITEGQVVFFDAGTTTMQVAQNAPKDGSMLAVTNSPRLAVELGKEDNDVKLTGGTLRRRTRSLVGPTAESFLERTNFDLLFLGANAVDVESGLTTPNEEEARVKELMVQRASRVVLVADASKIGERSFVTFADLSDVDLFVTAGEIDDEVRERFEAEDVTLVVADEEVVAP